MAERTSIIYTAEDKTKAATDAAAANVKALTRELDSLKSISLKVGQAFGVSFGVGAAVALFKDIVARTIEAERTMNQFAAVLQSTGHAAGLTAGEIRDLVKELSETTAFDDDKIQQAANALLRFQDISGETFKQILRVAPSVSLALGSDLTNAVQVLGKAIQNPLAGSKQLEAAGVHLGESQKALIQTLTYTGDRLGAAKVLLDEVTKSMGGTAGSENQGLYGATRSMEKAWDDMLKAFGKSPSIKGTTIAILEEVKNEIEDLDDAVRQFEEARTREQRITAAIRFLPTTHGAQRQLRVPSVVEPTSPEERAAAARESEVAAQGDRDREARLARDALNLRLIQEDKDSRALAKVRADISVTAAQTQAQQLQESLDIAHARGLVSERDYYDARTAIAQDAARDRIAAVNSEIRSQEAALSRRDDDPRAIPPEARGAIRADIARLKGQRDQIAAEVAGVAEKNNEGFRLSEVALGDAIAEVSAKLEEQMGNFELAADIREGIATRDIRAQLAKSKDPRAAGDIETLNAAKDLGKAVSQIATQEQLANQIRAQGAAEEERIQNSRRVGAINDLEALKQTDEARKTQLEGLRKVLAAEEAINIKTPDQIEKIKQLRVEIDSLASSADLLGDKFRTTFEDSLTDPLTDFITGTKKADEAFKQFIENLSNSLARIASQNIAESVFGKGGAGSAAPNFFAQLFGGGAASTSGAATGSGAYAVTNSSAGTLFAGGGVSYMGRSMDLPRFAYGGASGPNRPSIFAEGNMAEAAVPLPDGRTIPVTMKGGGGTVVNVNFYGQADSATVRQSALQAANVVNQTLARAQQRR